VGTVSNLLYEVSEGVGYLWGEIQDYMGKVGASMQYSGVRVGDGGLKITGVDHVALVSNPRDNRAIFSDSEASVIRYRDSADNDTETETTETEATETEATTPETITSEVELTEGVIDQIYNSLFQDPKRLEDLLHRIHQYIPESTAPDTETAPQPATPGKPEQVSRLIIKPRSATDAVPKKATPTIQRPFKGLL
jgi:hypothetical protein